MQSPRRVLYRKLIHIVVHVAIVISSNATECPLQDKCRYKQIVCTAQLDQKGLCLDQESFCAAEGHVLRDVSVVGESYNGLDFRHLFKEELAGIVTSRLTLRSLGIEVMDDGVFQGTAQALTILDLGQNRLMAIPSDSLIGLNKLVSLDLSSNLLTTIPANALRWLVSLLNLNLLGNCITDIRPRDFSWVPGLQSLDLSYNDIVSISPDDFAVLPELQYLDLHGTALVCDCRLAWLRNYSSCLCALSCDDLCQTPTEYQHFSPIEFPVDECPSEMKTNYIRCESSRRCANYSDFSMRGFLETRLPSRNASIGSCTRYVRSEDDKPKAILLPASSGVTTPSEKLWLDPSRKMAYLGSTSPDKRLLNQQHHHRSWFMAHAAFVFPTIAFVLILFITLCLWAFLGRRCTCTRLAFGMRMRDSCESFITETSHVIYSSAHVTVEGEQADAKNNIALIPNSPSN